MRLTVTSQSCSAGAVHSEYCAAPPRRRWSRARSDAGRPCSGRYRAARPAPRSGSIGLGGLGHDFGDAQRVEMLGHAGAHLPGRVGVGARQELHDRQQMAEMLAVVAAPTAEDRALLGGRFQPRFGEDGCDRRTIFVLERRRIGRRCLPSISRLQRLSTSNSSPRAPAPVEPFGHPPGAFLAAVAEAHRPLGCKLAMIGDFLDRLMREFAQELVARLGSAAASSRCCQLL